MSTVPNKNNRIYYLDVLRVIACLSVIMVHSSAPYVVKNIGSFNFLIGNIFNSITRIGVPLFVMISGALMLDKNYQFSIEKLMKHITRMFVFLVFGLHFIVYFLIYSYKL
ncbi:MAG: acyltransferase family protein [Erysipelotrichaceae bacterium]|nr:acyltransferase family protein [Erysipelotrichaceae bacterium]